MGLHCIAFYEEPQPIT